MHALTRLVSSKDRQSDTIEREEMLIVFQKLLKSFILFYICLSKKLLS